MLYPMVMLYAPRYQNCIIDTETTDCCHTHSQFSLPECSQIIGKTQLFVGAHDSGHGYYNLTCANCLIFVFEYHFIHHHGVSCFRQLGH